MKASFKELGTARLLRWASALLARAGHAALATQLFRIADSLVLIELPPFAYALALWRDGQFQDAKLTLTKILDHKPEHAEANNLLGVIFFEEDQIELAGNHFRQAITARPDFAAPRNNLGNIHRDIDELEEAERCYRAALGCDPFYVEALTNLGIVLNLQGDNEAAEAHCRKAIELAPAFAGAHCNLGNVLLSLGRGGESVAAYREALRLQPGLPAALVNLALILEDSSYLIGTIDFYEKQLQRQPGNHLPHVRIAQAFQALGRWDEGRQRLARALELKAESAEALHVLGVNYVHVGDVRTGIDCFRRALASGPNPMVQMGNPFYSMYLENLGGGQLCALYRDWAEHFFVRPRCERLSRDWTQSARRLRIGYVSRDFARHSVAYFLEPLLKHHDRSRIEVFCYSTQIKADDFTDRFLALADNWRDISTLHQDKVVDLVRKDEIDILVDLSGHTVGNRLGVFACKPAPVQVTYLGHPATTGLAAIDYRFGDAIADPTELTSDHYVERLWHLPGCFVTYQPPADAPEVASAPVSANGHVTFGSFNNVAKINDHVIAVWAEILAAIPSSRLLLKGAAFASNHGQARLVDGFARHGITPDRLELIIWRADLKSHLELYGEIDIALDPFPYNGTTTSCEALWMGVPVICLEGDRHSGRVGASLLTALGLRDLLAHGTSEYVRIAVELANDPERLIGLREDLRDRMLSSALLDHAGFTRGIEDAYQEMWRNYCQSRVSYEGNSGIEREADAPEEAVSLDIAGVATMRVPNSLAVMTRYVVEERGDWFEDEIRFVRRLLLPGQRVIDVGANYGVYTLSMAVAVGATGTVLSFEPVPTTTRWLRESVQANGFHQVEVLECAVSDKPGRGTFKVDVNAELSRLLDSGGANSQLIDVDITTLDLCREELRWGTVDFIKIDAEGQEPNVVRGGRQLLEDDSPLVMAEYRHGHELNHAVLDEFSRFGFHAYRLVPGLLILIPVDNVSDIDPYLLNLFFCKVDTADLLSNRGLLAPHGVDRNVTLGERLAHRWSGHLSGFPYARNWTSSSRDDDAAAECMSQDYANALNLYAHAQQDGLPPTDRLAALIASLAILESLAIENPSLAGRLTLARVRADFGLRNGARELFVQILDDLQRNTSMMINEPFLAPSRRFECVDCRGQLRDWLIAAVAEWLAANTGFSSFFNANESLSYLQIARRAGYGEGDIQRHIDLILRRKESNASCTN